MALMCMCCAVVLITNSEKRYRGTGASCIYPLLGCRRNSNWHFLATGSLTIALELLHTLYSLVLDVNEASLAYAEANIKRNRLEQSIDLYHNTQDQVILNKCMLKKG
jgi:23S rRNA A1618 N6-methylase RlmF